MSKIKKTIARVDPVHGVVHRDISGAYELSMYKKYGYNWKKKMRELGKSLRHTDDLPKVEDTPLPQIEITKDQ